MASLLVSALKAKIAAGFKGRLLTGIIRRETPSELDSWGDPTVATVETATFEGIRQDFSARYKAQAGIPVEDVSILILLGSTTITPDQDDKIYMNAPWNQWYQIRQVLEIDPAGASALCQAYEIPAP